MNECVCNMDALVYIGDDYSLDLVCEKKPLNIKSYHICPNCNKIYQVNTDFTNPLHPEISYLPQFSYYSVHEGPGVEGFLLRDYDQEDIHNDIASIQKVIIKGFVLVYGSPRIIQFQDVEDSKVFWISAYDTWDEEVQEYVYKKMPYFILNNSVDTLNIIKKALNRKRECVNLIRNSINTLSKYTSKIPDYISLIQRQNSVKEIPK